MKYSTEAIAKLIFSLCELLELAGDAVVDIAKRDDLGIIIKPDQSPCTDADLTADQIIQQGLKKMVPEWPILSEEGVHASFEERKNWEYYWLLDPLDATRSFIHDHGLFGHEKKNEYTINLALIHKHKAILGFIYQPTTGVGFLGGLNFSSFKWKQRESKSRQLLQKYDDASTTFIDSKLILSRNKVDDSIKALLTNLNLLNYIQYSGATKFCAIAAKEAGAYLRLGSVSEWDVAAGQAIIEGVGGRVMDFEQNDLRYNLQQDFKTPSFLATGLPYHPLIQQLSKIKI